MEAWGSPESARREGAHSGLATEGAEGRLLGGRYRIIRPLGSGGMGTVYLCEHVVLGRRVAIKVLHADRATDPELVERFRQEARAASSIDQENVVDVLDYGQDPGGALYYVMEVLDGRSLGQVLREDGLLPVGRALGLLEQVCHALAAAHARGVIHRDVKPDNILVERLPDGTERAKLIDFGISLLPEAGRLTRNGDIIGTPEYMAPEQASGTEVSALTDVYAAGVLAYELLTGTLPLEGTTAIATLVAHQTLPPSRPGTRRAGLPAAVDRLVMRALAKRPGDRFPSIQAMATEVTQARLALDPASAEDPAPPRTVPEQPPRSARWVAAAAAVAVLALAAALVGAITLGARPGQRSGPVAATVAAPSVVTTPTAAPPAAVKTLPPPAPSAPVPPPVEEARPAAAPRHDGAAPATGSRRREEPRHARPPAGDELHDPYAAPADSLKPDPFR